VRQTSATTRLTAGSDSSIVGSLSPLGGAPAPLVPTLEELGVTAPEGASVTLDESGRLTVESTGPIVIDSGRFDIEGITGITLRTSATISVVGSGIELPASTDLQLVGNSIEYTSISSPSDPIIGMPICERLVPVASFTVAREPFTLVAAREVPVEIALRKPRRRHPAFARRLRIVILGSPELDIRDIDRRSLRLGAEPGSASRGGRRARVRDFNRDGIRDLVVRFPNPGIALADDRLCLHGATYHGPAIAGCATFEPHPIADDADSDDDSDSRRQRQRRRFWR